MKKISQIVFTDEDKELMGNFILQILDPYCKMLSDEQCNDNCPFYDLCEPNMGIIHERIDLVCNKLNKYLNE